MWCDFRGAALHIYPGDATSPETIAVVDMVSVDEVRGAKAAALAFDVDTVILFWHQDAQLPAGLPVGVTVKIVRP